MSDPGPDGPASAPVNPERTWQDDPVAVVLLLLLTFVAGGADATTFLFVGGAFVSNQTGTVLLLAMDAGGADVVDSASAVASIGAFLIGASFGGRLMPRLNPEERWPARTAAALVLEIGVILICIALSWFTDAPPAWIVGLLAFAMGQQAALAARIAMPYLTTGFITGVVAQSAMESPVGDRSRRWWWYAATPVATIAAGALVMGVIAARAVPAALVILALLVAVAAFLSLTRDRVRPVPGNGDTL